MSIEAQGCVLDFLTPTPLERVCYVRCALTLTVHDLNGVGLYY